MKLLQFSATGNRAERPLKGHRLANQIIEDIGQEYGRDREWVIERKRTSMRVAARRECVIALHRAGFSVGDIADAIERDISLVARILQEGRRARG